MSEAAREARVRARKDWLKRLAAERRDAWMIAVRPSSLDGATRIHTKNEELHLEDGVVVTVVARGTEASIESPLVGMAVAGWVGDADVLLPDYRPGARVVLWRRGRESDEHTALAMTGRVLGFGARRPRRGPESRNAPPRSRSPRSESSARPRSGVRRARPSE